MASQQLQGTLCNKMLLRCEEIGTHNYDALSVWCVEASFIDLESDARTYKSLMLRWRQIIPNSNAESRESTKRRGENKTSRQSMRSTA